MKQRKLLIAIISVVLVALISIGATLAYLIATDAEDNEVTIGDVSIELLEYQRAENGDLVEFVDDKLLLPAVTYDYSKTATVSKEVDENNIGATVWESASNPYAEDKMVFVKNTGTLTNAYVRLCFAFEAGNYASFEQFQNKIHLNINSTDWTWTWDKKLAEVKGMKCFIAWATYNEAIAPDEITTFGMSQIALDGEATNADSYSFGDKYDVLVLAQGIQADGMGTATAALDEGFGTDVPFVGFRYVTFATLKTALHYLDANVNGTTFKGAWDRPNTLLNTVTFGLFEDYYEKVLGHEGVATTNASGDGEFEGYTYYVPNGDKYDLYVLTDSGVIYMPKDCTSLFYRMTALKSVNTDNMDVSKVTTMYGMFNGCGALEELDVTGWDVGKVDSLRGTFKDCSSLTELAVDTWKNVNAVTTLRETFHGCRSLTSLNISNWNVINVTDMEQTFKGCESLETLDIASWDVGNVKNMIKTFQGCSSLTGLPVSGWDVGKVTTMNYIFDGCKALTSDKFNVSGWDVSNVIDFSGMFNGCAALTTLDLSAWQTGSATETWEMFQSCKSLTTLKISNWNVSKVTVMRHMFNGCDALSAIDISGWNTASLGNTAYMFANCDVLTTIYVGDGWNVGEGASSTNMFHDSRSLKGGSGTVYNSANVEKDYAIIDGGASNPGYLTKGPAPTAP